MVEAFLTAQNIRDLRWSEDTNSWCGQRGIETMQSQTLIFSISVLGGHGGPRDTNDLKMTTKFDFQSFDFQNQRMETGRAIRKVVYTMTADSVHWKGMPMFQGLKHSLKIPEIACVAKLMNLRAPRSHPELELALGMVHGGDNVVIPPHTGPTFTNPFDNQEIIFDHFDLPIMVAVEGMGSQLQFWILILGERDGKI
jgi:hypothetical protein